MTSPTIDSTRLDELINAAETDLIELKREWWDLEGELGKGQLARSVLAMANTLAPGVSGFIVIGVEDKKAGGAVLGVERAPSQEAVAQVLDTYTNPVPRIRLDDVPLAGKRVCVLEVMWSELHPHYATRDVDSVLSTDVVYIRRAGTIGRLKPSELERLLRAKEARVGRITETVPLAVGFVELSTQGYNNRIAVRVANVIEEPITNINASVDFIPIRYPNAVYRIGLIANQTLRPGETREFECKASDATFYDDQGKLIDETKIWSGWIDVRVHVMYRGRDGLYSRVVLETSLG